MQLSTNLPFEQMITRWASILNPIIAIQLLQGRPLEKLSLLANTPKTINHFLGRNQVGFIITDQTDFASIRRTEPWNSQTLTLESNADVTINLWNY